MKFAVMQPYLLPYIGYWQLMRSVDVYVVYDNVQFIKGGWINRNRLLQQGKPQWFSIPLEKASYTTAINQRRIAGRQWDHRRKKLLAQIKLNYQKAPFFEETIPLVVESVSGDAADLFSLIHHSLRKMRDHVGLDTELVTASSLQVDHSLRNKEKLWAISRCLGIHDYVNPEAGAEIYDKREFAEHDVNLCFLRAGIVPYRQWDHEFVPGLSIIDVLMFNGRVRTRKMLEAYNLV